MRILSASYGEKPSGQTDHFHDCHQIIYIAAGEAAVTVGGVSYRAGRGSIVLVSRFERHAIEVESTSYRRYTLSLSSDAGDSVGDTYFLSSVLVNRAAGFRHVVDLGTYADGMEQLLRRTVTEYADRAPLWEELTDALLREILITLYRAAPELYSADRSRSADIVQEIQMRFERSYHESFSLADLAASYHISTSHLSHLFKKITGYAPMEHLKACRISAAKQHLAKSDLTVKEIVYRCGFSDESNFCRIFRQDTGMTPTAFRKKYGK